MRLRFVLPILSVILASVLFRIGDMQTDRIMDVRRKTGFVEPVPDSYARARYVEYALNAPAWATLGERGGMIRYRSTYWTGRDLRYFLALLVMWYWLGLQLDKRFGARKNAAAQQRTWWGRALAVMYVLYGLFLWHLMLPEFVPLRGYGHWLPHREYEPWFIAAVISWGIGMAFVGSYLLLRGNASSTSGAVGPV